MEDEPERYSVKTFLFGFFFPTVRQSCWAAVGLVAGTFLGWGGEADLDLCVFYK